MAEHQHEHPQGCNCGHHHEHQEHAVKHTITDKMKKQVYSLDNLGCAHCAAKMEEAIHNLPGVGSATITFATKKLCVYAEEPDAQIF